MVDYNKKCRDILNNYYSAIARYSNIKTLLSNKDYEIKEEDIGEIKKIKSKQIDEILLDYSLVVEESLKYIIKTRRMELYPKEPYDEVPGDKGFKEKQKLQAPVIRDLAKKQDIDKEDLERVLKAKEEDNNIKYLFLIVDKIMPDIKENYNEIIFLNRKSKEIDELLSKEKLNTLKKELVTFPNVQSLSTEDEQRVNTFKILNQSIKNKKVTNEFSNLREYIDNINNKKLSIDEINEIVNNLIFFIEVIHINNERLNINSEVAFSLYVLDKNPDYTTFNQKELTKLYAHHRLRNNPIVLSRCIFSSNQLSLNEILEILAANKIPEQDYINIFNNGINLDTIKYFKGKGISSYDTMRYQLIKKSEKVVDQLVNLAYSKKYTLDEYEELRKQVCDDDNDLSNMALLNHLSLDSVLLLKKDKDLLNFFKEELYQDEANKSYDYSDNVFKNLLRSSAIKEHKEAWFGLDVNQLDIYYKVSTLLYNKFPEELNVNSKECSFDKILRNIDRNVELFKDRPELLTILPLMLDPNDNDNTLNLLIDNGLRIDRLKEIDSTIFCLPPKFIKAIVKSEKMPLVVDNNINTRIMDLLEVINQTRGAEIDINRRVMKVRRNEEVEELELKRKPLNQLIEVLDEEDNLLDMLEDDDDFIDVFE